MGSLFEELDAREAAARACIEELRQRIVELTEPPKREESVLSRLEITRETVTEILGEAGTQEPIHAAGASRFGEGPPFGVLTVPPRRPGCPLGCKAPLTIRSNRQHATFETLCWPPVRQARRGGGELKVTLRVASESAEDEVRSLHDWLLLDRVVRREARVEMASSSMPVPGQQGAVLDLVSLVIGNGISAASLGLSIASWRATRPQEPTITVERADGGKVTITGTSRDEAQRLIEQLLDEQQ